MENEEIAADLRSGEKNMWAGVVITVIIALLTTVGGIAIAYGFMKTKKEPKKVARTNIGLLVGTEKVEKATHALKVSGQGSVVAARELLVMPEVSGRITAIHDQLTPGGLIKKGDRVVKVNAQETSIAVQEQQTVLEQARAQLAMEKGQQAVARKEWELFKGKDSTADASLALREPQLKNAEVAVDAANARLNRARLNLSRTSLKAPFDALVVSEAAEVGQLVGPNMQIARLVGTDAFWVQVSIPTDNLSMIALPNARGEGGALVSIEQRIGSRTIQREGKIVRLLPNLDPAGRQARLLVEIKDPLNLNDEKADPVPLLLDAYVRVTIDGLEVPPTIKIDRKLLHDGDNVYVFKDGALDIRKVEIVWRDSNSVLINGLESGEEVINTRLTSPVNGMKVRKAEPLKTDSDVSPTAQKTGDTAKETR